jgi:hypothetical protein
MAFPAKAKGKGREVSQPIMEGPSRQGPLTRQAARAFIQQEPQTPFRSTSVPADTSQLTALPVGFQPSWMPQTRQTTREPTEPLRDLLGGGVIRGSAPETLKEEPYIAQPQPFPLPQRLTTPYTPLPPESPLGTQETLPPLPISVPSSRPQETPLLPFMYDTPSFVSPRPTPRQNPVHGFGQPSPAAYMGTPRPPQLPPIFPGGEQGGQAPLRRGGQPMPPPPGFPGGGPGGPGDPFGGYPPPPPGSHTPAAQPYYVYYLPQQNEEGVKLKEPDVFTGKDSAKLPPFITQCTHWFMAKPRKFPTERDRVLFAASYLRDLANQWWMPLLTQTPPAPLLDDWATFTSELHQMFGNQHLQTTSQNAILDMKMKEEGRVSEYLVRFNSHAVYTGWNDAALANHFYRGLPRRIRERFMYTHRPQTLVAMRAQALDFDQMYWEYQEELGNKPKPDAQNEQGKGKKGKDKADNSSSQQNQAQATDKAGKQQSSGNKSAQTQKSGQKGSAATSDQAGPRAPLTQQQKDERRAKGLCLYCGGEGHSVANCPKIPSTRRQAATGRATYTFTPAESSTNECTAVVKAKRTGTAATTAENESAQAGNSSPT